MVRKKWDFPKYNELVVGTVKKINPNSILVELSEYGKDGMVHVSEVASGWVRDIRQFAKLGETLVTKVINVEEDRGFIYLSMKRVTEYERKHKLDEWKRERKAENLLAMVAKNLGKTLDDAYDHIGYPLQEEFGEMYVGFETALKNPQLLEKRGLDKQWIDAMAEVAAKELQEKETEVRGVLTLTITKPDGIEIIKRILGERKIHVSYISAPKYMLSYKGNDAKKAQKLLEEDVESIIQEAKKAGGEATFVLEKV